LASVDGRDDEEQMKMEMQIVKDKILPLIRISTWKKVVSSLVLKE
jgi:hypothetical protein